MQILERAASGCTRSRHGLNKSDLKRLGLAVKNSDPRAYLRDLLTRHAVPAYLSHAPALAVFVRRQLEQEREKGVSPGMTNTARR